MVEPPKKPGQWQTDYVRYGSVGISIVITSALYIFLGYRAGIWLDKRFDASPIFLVTFVTLATILSVVSLILRILVLSKEMGNRGTGDGGDD